MKLLKKATAIFLVFVMVLGAAPILGIDFSTQASAAVFNGYCGWNVTWSYDNETKALTISGSGDMATFDDQYYDDYDEAPWYEYCNKIKTVTITEGVKNISPDAFSYCAALTSVTIPASVELIDSYAFNMCTSLTSVSFANGSKLEYVGEGAFYSCTALTNITLPSSVTRVGYDAFYNTALFNDEANWDNGALYVGSCLVDYNCDESVNNAQLVIADGTTVIADSLAFWCESLQNITIPSTVITIGDYAFSSCSSLEIVNIPASVEYIGEGAFDGCYSLKSFNVAAENGYYSSDASGVLFNKDKTLLILYPLGSLSTSYAIPSTVISVGEYAFVEAENLIDITIPESVTKIGYNAFYYCGYYNDSANWTDNVLYLDNCLLSADLPYGTRINKLTVPEGTRLIADDAFVGSRLPNTLILPESVTIIGNEAFAYTNGYGVIYIPGDVTDIGVDAFYDSQITIAIDSDSSYVSDYAYEYGIDCLTNQSPYTLSIAATLINFPYAVRDLFYRISIYWIILFNSIIS